jgi:hypothetical protein
MDSDTASAFRSALEAFGVATQAMGVGLAVLVQVHLYRAVRSKGSGKEHDDFKIRIEEQQREDLRKELAMKDAIIMKLKEAHQIRQKEKRDVEAMKQVKETEFQNPVGGDAVELQR